MALSRKQTPARRAQVRNRRTFRQENRGRRRRKQRGSLRRYPQGAKLLSGMRGGGPSMLGPGAGITFRGKEPDPANPPPAKHGRRRHPKGRNRSGMGTR